MMIVWFLIGGIIVRLLSRLQLSCVKNSILASVLFLALFFSCEKKDPQVALGYLDFDFGRISDGNSGVLGVHYIYFSDHEKKELVEPFLNYYFCEVAEVTPWNKSVFLINSLKPFGGFNCVHDDVDYEELREATFFSAIVTTDSIIMPHKNRSGLWKNDSIFHDKLHCNTEIAFIKMSEYTLPEDH